MKESIFMDRIRDVFSTLDRAVYSLIGIFNDTINDLTHVTIISNDTLNDIAMKVYGLIALFMIFKISFSLINYIVNPDLISDKAKGGGALIKNIVITFALVITVPFAFNLLYEAQNAILSDGIIEKYLLNADGNKATYTFSMSDECGGIKATTSDAGDYIGLMAFKPFFQLEEGRDITDWNNDVDSVKTKYCNANATISGDASVNNLLKNASVYSAPHGVSVDKIYVVDYTFFLSTAIGVVIALIFLSFCFDIAVRTIKLQFLELIAPVPIISYIDPDSSKNGMFKKWIKEVFSTWLSLFMRLATIDFAIYIIGMIADVDLGGNNLWLKLLIIIGALIFAKQLPKLLENILGIKLGESFNLNPLKKIGNDALGGKALIGLGAGSVGAVGGGIAGFRAGAQAGAPGRGTAIGIINGFNNGKSDPKKAFSNGMNKTYKSLTGNEMSTMTPSRMLMGIGGKGTEKVDQMKGHLATARNRLYNAQSELNRVSYSSSHNSERLQQMGINPNTVKSDQQSIEALKTKYESAAAQYNDFKGKLQMAQSNYNATPTSETKADLEKIQEKYNTISNQYEISKATYDYASAISQEKEIRGQIGKIEKEISTLSDEKKQRETFWQVDTSPKTSVGEAMDHNPIQKDNK